MPHELDYASPGYFAPRVIRFLSVLAVSLSSAFLLTMGVWSREHAGWASPAHFNIEVTRTAWGLPHWLIHNRVRSSGAPPPMSSAYLPDFGRYQPGWHIDGRAVCFSIAGCLAVSLLVSVTFWLLGIRYRSTAVRRNVVCYAIAVMTVMAGGLGWFSDTHPGPAAVVLIFVVLPIMVAAAAFASRTYPGGVLLATVATLAYWWAFRMSELRWPTNGNLDIDDLSVMSISLIVLIVVAVGSTFVGRQRALVRPAASQSISPTDS